MVKKKNSYHLECKNEEKKFQYLFYKSEEPSLAEVCPPLLPLLSPILMNAFSITDEACCPGPLKPTSDFPFLSQTVSQQW